MACEKSSPIYTYTGGLRQISDPLKGLQYIDIMINKNIFHYGLGHSRLPYSHQTGFFFIFKRKHIILYYIILYIQTEQNTIRHKNLLNNSGVTKKTTKTK